MQLQPNGGTSKTSIQTIFARGVPENFEKLVKREVTSFWRETSRVPAEEGHEGALTKPVRVPRAKEWTPARVLVRVQLSLA